MTNATTSWPSEHSLTIDRIRSVLRYSPETGEFHWAEKTCFKVVPGKLAGCVEKSRGYVEIAIDGRQYKAHRLAFAYMNGRWPADQIDHINGDSADNRWANLREATHTENQRNKPRQRNNTSGIKGVTWDRCRRRWKATIRIDKVLKHIGYFDDLLNAGAARRKAELLHFGEFAKVE